MREVSFNKLHGFLNAIDWSGHVEIGDQDKRWLAFMLNDFLNPQKDKTLCDSCGNRALIVLKTVVGTICEDCIEDFSDEAETIRKEAESG